jgi:hypothetical protein
LKSDDELFGDEPTGEVPLVSATDSRVTITGAEIAAEATEEAPLFDEETLLPHWTDAPTGQVPIVVAREAADSDDPWAAVPAPAWREGEADWVAHEEQFDASILAGEAKEEGDARPWEFVEDDETVPEVEVEVEVEVEAPRPEPSRLNRTRRTVTANPLAGRAVRQSSPSSVSTATATGVLLAAIVVGIFLAGTIPVAVLVLVALGLAAAEAYAAFRAVGARARSTCSTGWAPPSSCTSGSASSAPTRCCSSHPTRSCTSTDWPSSSARSC